MDAKVVVSNATGIINLYLEDGSSIPFCQMSKVTDHCRENGINARLTADDDLCQTN